MTLDYHDQGHWANNFGQAQSPVHLTGTPAGTTALTLTAPYRITQVAADDTTLRLFGTGAMRLDGRAFQFVQAHVHAPVEHQLDAAFDLELHLVHEDALGQPCVVAILLPVGPADPALAAAMATWRPGAATPLSLDLTPFFPHTATMYRYRGSLTTPPLTEGVTWCVLAQTEHTVSAAQVTWCTAHFGANARAIQPLNARPVLCAQLDLQSTL
ncbi:carbonic anhydrase family protein [Lacticaseibacillus daqingensis]|uniref:carbonic anhydrase family protein n=1 Tax=Lacticaseibacillus daqingensis TaxID=2486014 RepID=UPI000F768DA4|nr:carbonic anhydrase family protein [Lacticaseibacillus daqingensis]